jgi:hypothetical protein
LRASFNRGQLRRGDMVADSKRPQSRRFHPNHWDMQGVQLAAYKQVGRRPGKRTGRSNGAHCNTLGMTCRGLELISASAQAHIRAVSCEVRSKVIAPCHAGAVKGMLVNVGFDGTPWIVKFGTLHHRVAPHARYFIKDVDTKKWKSVDLQQYRTLGRGGSAPTRGSLELFAQVVNVVWTDVESHIHCEDVVCKPVFLQNGKASTIKHAVVTGAADFSPGSLVKLSEKLKYIFYSAVPDQCPSNKRAMAAVREELGQRPNILVSPVPGCCVHILHGAMEHAMCNDTLTGDVHSTQAVNTNVHHNAKLVAAFDRLMGQDSFFQWDQVSMPDPAWQAHTRAVLHAALLCDTRGSLDADGVSFFGKPGEQWTSERIENCLIHINGDTRSEVAIHYERACGRCSSLQEARHNFQAACNDMGLLLNGYAIKLPSKARWGSLRDSLAQQTPGCLIYGLLPRCTVASAAKWHDGDPGAADSADYRAWHRSKAWRSKCTMSSPDYIGECVTHYWTTLPQHRLWKRLEHLDAAGGSHACT